jgi:hypothetical protein
MNERNEFRTCASLLFKGAQYTKVDVKIDTGCGYSSFPARRLGLSEKAAYDMKTQDCRDENIRKAISFGVNDSITKRKEDVKKFKKKMFMELTSITFNHCVENLILDDYDIGRKNIKISYDRTGNILIGMDILKSLDVHFGTAVDGRTILLACKGESLTKEYLKELNSLFNVREVI